MILNDPELDGVAGADPISAFEEAYSLCRARSLASDRMVIEKDLSRSIYTLRCTELDLPIHRYTLKGLRSATARLRGLIATKAASHEARMLRFPSLRC